jgi:regulator of RNase E activity RraA
MRVEGRPVAAADVELFTHIERNLYTAVLSDALDDLGIRDRAMYEHLRPVSDDLVFAGWARTVSCVDLHYTPEDPYALEIEALDSVLPGEVVVVGTGESKRNAPWGELLSTAAMARGARGAVVDGLIRDVKKILALGFPVFAAGMKPVDSRGRGVVMGYNVPVECGRVTV